MSRATVSSASPRAASKAWASSVDPSKAERTARGPEQAATELSRRRRRAGPRARGSGCLPAPGSKRNTAISLILAGPRPLLPPSAGVLAHRPAPAPPGSSRSGRSTGAGLSPPAGLGQNRPTRPCDHRRVEAGFGSLLGTGGFIVTRPLIWMDQECDDLIGSGTRSVRPPRRRTPCG
jgi:hypothetical protein